MGPEKENAGMSPRKLVPDPVKMSNSIGKGKNKRLFSLAGLDDDAEVSRNEEDGESAHASEVINDQSVSALEESRCGTNASGLGTEQSLDNSADTVIEAKKLDETGKTLDEEQAFDEFLAPAVDEDSLPQLLFDDNAVDNSIEESIELDEDAQDAVFRRSTSYDFQKTSLLSNQRQELTGEVTDASISERESPEGSVLSEASEPIVKHKKNSRNKTQADSPDYSRTKGQKRSKEDSRKARSKGEPNVIPKVGVRTTSKSPSSSAVTVDSTGPRATSKGPGRAGSSGPTRLVQRSETPATDDGTYKTRSGRASYKPLAAWRGEKVIFGQRTDRDTPAPVTDIIRTEEVPITPKPAKKATRKVARRPRLQQIIEEVEESELEAEEPDPWEIESGIRHGLVMSWDQEAERYDEEHGEETGTPSFCNAERRKSICRSLTYFFSRTCLRSRCD